jgi:alpha-tubulin suppressor-like RCC1 family protein
MVLGLGRGADPAVRVDTKSDHVMRILVILSLCACNQIFGIPEVTEAKPDAAVDAPTCPDGFSGDGTYCVPASWQKIVTAGDYACGITGDSALYCWGDNGGGSLGDGTTTTRLRPTQVGTATDWLDVSVRFGTTCGIRGDHSLWCWGSGGLGQLGDGLAMTEHSPTKVSSTMGWSHVSVGQSAVCGIHDDGSLACWGFDRISGATRAMPVAVDANTDWTQIAVDRVQCGIRAGGALYCWGKSAAGELGLDTVTLQATPARVGTDTWKDVRVGNFNTCAIRSDNTLWCWGTQPALKTSLQYGATPVQIGVDSDWQAISVGRDTVLGVRASGMAYAWGNNNGGAVGQMQDTEFQYPTPVSGSITAWTEVSTDAYNACGVAGGAGYCWGAVLDGNIGNGVTANLYVPTRIGTDTFSSIGGGAGACGVRSDGALMCWGISPTVGVGLGNIDPVWVPTRVGTSNWTAATGGFGQADADSCALRASTQMAYCWGDNTTGQVGNGTTQTPQLSPIAVTPPVPTMTWDAIAVSDHSCALTGGELWCWGANDSGELGDGTTTQTMAPTAALPGTWLQVTVSAWGAPGGNTCAIRADRTLWCWGADQFPAATTHAVPTQLGTAATWAQISTDRTQTTTVFNGSTTCGVQTDGSLWCWGQWLGDGTMNSSATPVRVGTDSDWKLVAVGGSAVCAIKTTGTLWCWANSMMLGDGSPYNPGAPATHPTQIGTDSDWATVITNAAYDSWICGLKSDNSVWCWGFSAAPITGILYMPNKIE